VRARERVGQAQLNECLPSHADPLRFAVDCTQQIYRKVDIYALDFTPGARGLWQIKMCGQVFTRVVHLVEASGDSRPSPGGIAPLRLRAHGGPR
jgi:hypothetical protein